MTNVISFAKVKATNSLTVNKENFTKDDYLDELYAFDFAGIYELCMANPEWKEIVLTRSIHTHSISIGILIAQHVKKDDKATKALHTIFNKCIKETKFYYPLRSIPPFALGYVWVPPVNGIMTSCELFVAGRMRRD